MGAAGTRPTIESTLAAIVAHPVRARAFTILNERTASPNEIAKEIGEATGNVSYHVRKLEELGAIELVDEQKRRGAVEHFYRATKLALIDDETWRRLTPAERQPVSLYALQLCLADMAVAIDSGSFDRRHDRYLTRTRILADEEGWNELNRLHAEMMERTLEIKAACADRFAKKGDSDDALSVLQVAMFFEEGEAAPGD